MSDHELVELLDRMSRFPASSRTLRGKLVTQGTFEELELLVARRSRSWRVAPERWPEGRFFGGMPRWLPPEQDALLHGPLSLAATHVIHLRGHSGVAGRLTRRAEATPRRRLWGQTGIRWGELGSVEVDVDVEEGVVLAAAALPDRAPIYRFLSFEVDVDITDEELKPPSPPPARPAHPSAFEREVSLSAASSMVAFPLFRPTLLPSGAQERVSALAPSGPLQGRVTLSYEPPNGRWGLTVTLMTTEDARGMPMVREDEEVVEEDGLRCELWTNAGSTHLSLDREGSNIALRGAYPRTEILRVARSLVAVDRA